MVYSGTSGSDFIQWLGVQLLVRPRAKYAESLLVRNYPLGVLFPVLVYYSFIEELSSMTWQLAQSQSFC